MCLKELQKETPLKAKINTVVFKVIFDFIGE